MSGYSAGAIMLYRKMVEWQWYQDAGVKTVFLHLLLVVNWKGQKWKKLYIKRGQKLTSYPKLAEQTGLTLKQVRRAMGSLRDTGEIRTERAGGGLLVTVVNYDVYQRNIGSAADAEGRERAEDGQQINKDNKDNTENRYTVFSDEIKKIFDSGGWSELPQQAEHWVETYPVEWLREAVTRSVNNCGVSPPPRYVQKVLENFEKNGGTGNASKRGSKKRAPAGAGKKRKPKGKYSEHPAGSGERES